MQTRKKRYYRQREHHRQGAEAWKYMTGEHRAHKYGQTQREIQINGATCILVCHPFLTTERLKPGRAPPTRARQPGQSMDLSRCPGWDFCSRIKLPVSFSLSLCLPLTPCNLPSSLPSVPTRAPPPSPFSSAPSPRPGLGPNLHLLPPSHLVCFVPRAEVTGVISLFCTECSGHRLLTNREDAGLPSAAQGSLLPGCVQVPPIQHLRATLF